MYQYNQNPKHVKNVDLIIILVCMSLRKRKKEMKEEEYQNKQ